MRMRTAVEEAKQRRDKIVEQSLSWSGNRKFEVVRKEAECIDESICSFYLKPHDGKQIPNFEPGQYLTFELKVPNETANVTRCYSLSDAFNEDLYRVSIKKVPAPPDQPEVPAGVASHHFHQQINVGDILDVRAPSGKFYLDMSSDRPIVLIGGGVGITPVLSMLNSIRVAGGDREVWFFLGTVDGDSHPMRAELMAAREELSNLNLVVCYSRPKENDEIGIDYDQEARVSVDLFKRLLPSNNYQFLMCGPPRMMEDLIADLKAWGVPNEDILRESFGPASGRKSQVIELNADASGPLVTFKKSGKTANWDPQFDNLVKFAEANGCDIPYACLAGNCGTCVTTLIEGEVSYSDGETDFEAESGTFLACSCVPNGEVVIDA